MSEKPPTTNGENPPHTEPDSGRSLDDVAEANIVPATEQPSQEEIDTVIEHLNWRVEQGTDTPPEEEPRATRPSSGAHAPSGTGHTVAATTGGHAGHGGTHGGSKVGKMFGGVFALFGWFFVHVVWQGITRAHEMLKGGGGRQ